MAEYIVMPTLGFDMEEGTMGPWLKSIGDAVSKGDILAEIESDKVTQELQARADGLLLAQFVQTGDLIPVGSNLGVIGAEGEDVSGMVPDEDGSGPSSEETAVSDTPAPEAGLAASAPAPKASGEAVSDEFPDGVKATPVARRMAEDKGVDLKRVNGSGPNGRIRKADVEAYIENPPAEATKTAVSAIKATPVAPAAPAEIKVGPDDTVVDTPRLRQAIARRMTESKTTVPHFQVTSEIDMEAAMALRKQINGALPPEKKVTVNDIVVKATGLALRDFPNLNASFYGDKMVLHNRINVGSAVAIEGGLLTVVQKDTDSSTISKIAVDHKEMIGRAREGKVQPEDVSGGTFTVSNLGGFDVDNFIAIINPPDAAILAIGSAKKVPVVVDGEIKIGFRMKATISADHRISDGAEAAKYMQKFKALLENPLQLLL